VESRVKHEFDAARSVLTELTESEEAARSVAEAARTVVETIRAGRKVLLCGNGGSAADSQHIASEIVGRFRRERDGWPAVALSTDTSILTSVGNDYGFAEVFRRQVEALGRKGDCLIAYSTSGNSENVIRAVEEAKDRGLRVIVFTGASGGRLADLGDVVLYAPSETTARIQECHAVMGHAMCDVAETELADPEEESP
jgi:D-sedoheptulose 7-phosphate isomerase